MLTCDRPGEAVDHGRIMHPNPLILPLLIVVSLKTIILQTGNVMIRKIHTILLFVGIVFVGMSTSTWAQNQPNPAQMALINKELEERGLTLAEAESGLQSRGINLQNLSPEQLMARQKEILKVLDDIARQKRMGGQAKGNSEGNNRQNSASNSGEQAAESVDVREPRATQEEKEADEAAMVAQKAALQKKKGSDIYGHNLFTDQSLAVFRTTEGAKAPDHYTLGAGDQLRITIFGNSQDDLSLEINPQGYVQPSGMAQIYLQGIRLGDARRLLFQRLSGAYRFRSDQFSVTLQTARTLQVSVFGETVLTGTFTLSALNSAFNALAAAGGPEEQGTVRKIQIIRGKERKTLDVYRFMKDPALQYDFDLQHNDVLFVPMAEQVVRLDGAVRRPMRYELIGGEGLKQLIDLAGGLRYNTYVEYVQIERIQADSVVLLEYRLQDILDGKQNPTLRDGDVVRIRESSRPLETYTEVVGAVFYPGRYDLTPNLTLAGALSRAQTTPESRLQFFMVERRRRDGTTELLRVPGDEADRFTLQPRDLIRVFDKATFTYTDELAVQGSVRRPFNRPFELGDMISLSDALQLAGGTEPTAHPEAFVRRRDPANPKLEEYLRVDLNQPGDFKLQAGDQLTVYDRMTYTRTAGLSISGAVRNMRTLTYDPKVNLSDLILMAGGFTESADPSRIDLFRLEYAVGEGSRYRRISLQVDSQYRETGSTRPYQLAPFDQIYVRKLPLFDLKRSVRIDGQIMYPGEYPLKEYRMHLSELIREAGGLNKLAEKKYAILIRSHNNIKNVGINLEKCLKNPGSRRYDPVLVEGDEVSILTFSNTVGIRLKATRLEEMFADVLGQEKSYEVSDYVYQGKHGARWYVSKLAGGFAEKADISSLIVRYPDGSVRGTNNYLIFKRTPPVQAGSVVALEYKFEKPKEEKKDVDVDLVFARTLQALTSLTTVLLLLTRL
ncbi:MAG: hypothetical protein FJ344_05550 [Sphingomonadales bacterium]|nr:hypothetical protein [Sphingomonadales bacterium]